MSLRERAAKSWEQAMAANLANIDASLSRTPPGGRLLDLGCDDGTNTLRFAEAARAKELHGVELVQTRAELARQRGIIVAQASLNERLPYPDDRFDLVVSNQVIEHLSDTDCFVSETRRVLRSGGVAIISTENLASWHNIGALVFGWQPFSLTNISQTRGGIGNPIALHRGDEPPQKSWEHVRVFGYRGLVELFQAHGFVDVRALGAGYFPLPAGFGRRDPRHAAFLTIVAS
jgi:SAM-dependent methyltransferase